MVSDPLAKTYMILLLDVLTTKNDKCDLFYANHKKNGDTSLLQFPAAPSVPGLAWEHQLIIGAEALSPSSMRSRL